MILEVNVSSLLVQQLIFSVELCFLIQVPDVVIGLLLGPSKVKMSRNRH